MDDGSNGSVQQQRILARKYTGLTCCTREIEMLLPIGMQWPLLEMLSFTGHISVATYGTWRGSRSFP